MARGSKHNEVLKEKAYALLTVKSVSEVAKELNLPYSTVKTWKKSFESNDENDFAELRQKNKRAFVTDAWAMISQIKKILERRINRALENEDEIDSLVDEVLRLSNENMNDTQRKAFLRRINAIKLDDVRELSILLGTLYDKQALASKEATAIIEGDMLVKKFEDYE